VRGKRRKHCAQYCFQNALDISKHVIVPEAQDSIIPCSKPFIADWVKPACRMLSAIHFDDQSTFAANEIHDVTSYRLLPNKLESTKLTSAQFIPQQQFSARGDMTQLSRVIRFAFVGASHGGDSPSPDTRKSARADLSPQAGRGKGAKPPPSR